MKNNEQQKNEEFYAAVSAIARFIERVDGQREQSSHPDDTKESILIGKDVAKNGYQP